MRQSRTINLARSNIDLTAAGTTDDKVTVYMGVAKDTEVDLEFEGERLVSISCRR